MSSPMEQAFACFVKVSEKMSKDGIAINLKELRDILDAGINLMVDAMNEMPTPSAPPVLDQLSPRAQVWIQSWAATMQSPHNTPCCQEAADSCLEEFDKIFPEYKGVTAP